MYTTSPVSYQRDPRRAAVWGLDIAPGRGVNDGRGRGDNRQHCPNAIRSLINNAACHCNNSVSVLRRIRSGQTEEKNKKMACTLTFVMFVVVLSQTLRLEKPLEKPCMSDFTF